VCEELSFSSSAAAVRSDRRTGVYIQYTKYTQQLGANTATWESWLSHISFAPSTGFRNTASMQNALTAQLHGMMRDSSKHFLPENVTVALCFASFLHLASKTMPLSGRNFEGFNAMCPAVLLHFGALLYTFYERENWT
jgi:hypothetical protein